MLSTVFLIFVHFAFQAAADDGDSKLIGLGLQKVMECVGEANVDIDLCTDMLKPDAKLDDQKYQICKCWIPCVAKKLNFMSEDGLFKEDEILKTINDVKTPGYKEEGIKVYEICKKVEGKNCDAGFNIVACVLKNSEKAKELVHMLLKAIGKE